MNRESYVPFADRFGIPTSTDGGNQTGDTPNVDEVRTEINMRIFEKFQRFADDLHGIPENISTDLDRLRGMLNKANALDATSSEFRTLRNEIQEFLL